MDGNKVVAIVPAFNPDDQFAERIAQLNQQVAHVVIVDDGSTYPVSAPDLPGVTVARQINRGIACAINDGIAIAKAEHPDLTHILTVDQDSVLCHDYVENALKALESAHAQGINAGAVCAEKFNTRPVKSLGGGPVKYTLEVAQSGMVFPWEVLRRFGYFDETLFIDGVDTEYALRLRVNRMLVITGKGCGVKSHSVGSILPAKIGNRQLRIGRRKIKYSHHSALRRYYISRNRILLLRRYPRCEPLWTFRDNLAESRTLILSILFGPRPLKQILGAILGAGHGLAGAHGRASAKIERILRET